MASHSSPQSHGHSISPNVADRNRRLYASPDPKIEPPGSLSPHDHWAGALAKQAVLAATANRAGVTTSGDAQWLGYAPTTNEPILPTSYAYDPYQNANSSQSNDFGLYTDSTNYNPLSDQSAQLQDHSYADNTGLNTWETVSSAENYQNQLAYNQGNGTDFQGMGGGQWINPSMMSAMGTYGTDLDNFGQDPNQPRFDLYEPVYEEEELQLQDAIGSYNPPGPITQSITREDILGFFQQHYASMLKSIPPAAHHTPNEAGEIMCRFCQPAKPVPQPAYRQHKIDVHGVNYDTGFQYKPPMDVRYLNNAPGCEGYCPSCDCWIALDLNQTGFNWAYHASGCQDNLAMNRWLSSASEDEAAPIEDIDRAAKKLARKQQMYTDRYLSGKDAPSVFGSSGSSNSNTNSISSVGSATSAGSANSVMSYQSLEGSLAGRRKKALRRQKRRGAQSSTPNSRQYQCTFCISDFVSFGDWRRHEENVHLVLNKWVCAPEGRFKPGTDECVYCDEKHEDIEANHKCNDRYCHGKEPADRVFSRKDHLKQHLRRVHGVQWRPGFEAWSIKTQGPTRSRCGFCDITFPNWNQRMHHIGWEFKNGHRMAFWQGDWGLEMIWMSEEKLGNMIMPDQREDHEPRSLRQSGPPPRDKRHSKNPVVIKNKLAQSKNAANTKNHSLQRKPRFNSLRSGEGPEEQHSVVSLPQQNQQFPQEFQQEQYLPEQYPPQQFQSPPQPQFQSPQQYQSPPDFHSSPQFQSPPQAQSQFQPQQYLQDDIYRQPDPYQRMAQEQQYQNIAPLQTVTTPPTSLLSPPDSTQNSAEVTPIVPTAAMHSCLFCGKRYTRQDNLRRHARSCTQAWTANPSWYTGDG